MQVDILLKPYYFLSDIFPTNSQSDFLLTIGLNNLPQFFFKVFDIAFEVAQLLGFDRDNFDFFAIVDPTIVADPKYQLMQLFVLLLGICYSFFTVRNIVGKKPVLNF